MRFVSKKSIMFLSLICLYISNPVGIVFSQSISPGEYNSGILPGSSNVPGNFELKVTKEKFNDVSGSITVTNPQDVLDLDKTFYPNLSSNYGDLTGLDILTFDKLRTRFEKSKRKYPRNGIQIEEVPQVYEIALSTFREESKDQIKNITLGNKAKPDSFIDINIKKEANKKVDTSSQKTIEEIGKLIAQGEIKKATAMLDKESYKPKKDAWFIVELASAYEQVNKNNRASSLYEKALALNPNRIEILYSYAHCLYKDNKYDKAENQLKKIIKIDNKFTLAHYTLGNVYFKKGRYYDALDSLNESIKLNPLSVDAYYNSALILELIGKKELALKYYNKCIQIKPNDNHALMAINRLSK